MSVYVHKNGTAKPVGGGTSPADRDRISALEQRINLLENKYATETEPGLVRLTKSKSVTDSTGLAVPSSELNAALEGSIAHKVAGIDERLNEFMQRMKVESFLIDYRAGNKEEALQIVDNPTIVLGYKLTTYAFLFRDSVGDSPYLGGITAFFGYCYPGDDYGAQLRMNYQDSKIHFRLKYNRSWHEWSNI